ncbi:hypothetical protein HPB47_001639 [Ixodes persulcatus]|uniref:Uncharacterized protein n=1 Tax=Ixodes persulcatus TaxID=34615 RepID=A0AC60PPS7_IXOPE|nr:hypothetical protein HPB47_001639 [Ixodes persulcatus]
MEKTAREGKIGKNLTGAEAARRQRRLPPLRSTNEDGNVILFEIEVPSSRWRKPLTEKPLLAYLAECKRSKDIQLRKSHIYYTQIQICMHVLQLDECNLFL